MILDQGAGQPPGAARPERWAQVLAILTALLPAGEVSVVIDGIGCQPAIVADRLATAVRAGQRACARLPGWDGLARTVPAQAGPGPAVVVADGPAWRASRRWDVVIWLRTQPPARPCPADWGGPGNGEAGADIVIDLHDPAWPVIRHVAAPLAGTARWYISETQAFFAQRAATWDVKFGGDLPGYAAAIAQAGIPVGGTVADIGCGTGRALPALRAAVGPHGTVLALDLTPEMLAQAHGMARAAHASLIVADARRLPLARACVDAVFAAGLINHLPDAEAGLRQLARITRPGGRLVLFHPSGRATLAARHGRALRPGEPLAEIPLRQAMGRTGWQLTSYDDGTRFLALATRGQVTWCRA